MVQRRYEDEMNESVFGQMLMVTLQGSQLGSSNTIVVSRQPCIYLQLLYPLTPRFSLPFSLSFSFPFPSFVPFYIAASSACFDFLLHHPSSSTPSICG